MNLIEEIQESWGWTGIEPEEVIGENAFGNLIIRDIHGHYWRVCPEEVYCRRIAESRTELDAISQDQEFLADWYMVGLTEQANQKFGPLENGRKYHLAIPAILGGSYLAENIRCVSLIEQIRFAGDIGKQIDHLPDGAQIHLNIIG